MGVVATQFALPGHGAAPDRGLDQEVPEGGEGQDQDGCVAQAVEKESCDSYGKREVSPVTGEEPGKTVGAASLRASSPLKRNVPLTMSESSIPPPLSFETAVIWDVSASVPCVTAP